MRFNSKQLAASESREARPRPQLVALSSIVILSVGAAPVDAQNINIDNTNVHDTNTHSGWDCRASESGDWLCREIPIAGPGFSSPTAKESNQRGQRLDWVPLEQLTEEQRQQVGVGCCGAFISPEPEDPRPPAEAEAKVEADRVDSASADAVHLQGNVKIRNGNLTLEAEAVDLEQKSGDASLSGNVVIRQPGLLFRGEKAVINRNTSAARIDKAEFVLHEQHIHGSAALLVHTESNQVILEDGRFSSCQPDNEQWYLRGGRITVDQDKHRGSARNIRLNFYGVPVFYSPYLIFPVGDERLSGFLFPTLSSEDISIPYYFNLAPNYDMTLAPRKVQDRGTMLEAEFRHLSPWFMHQLSGGWLGNGEDDISDNEQSAIDNGLTTIDGAPYTVEEATRYDGEDRWVVNLLQDGGKLRNLESHWYSSIDYTKVSDPDYFRHLDTTSVEISKKSHLLQAGELGYDFDAWHLSARVEEYQSIRTVGSPVEPYRQKPRLLAAGNYRWGDWVLSLNHQYTQFEHREKYYNPDNPVDPRIAGDRLRTDYQLSWDQQWVWGFFKPSALLKSLSYNLDPDTIAAGKDDSPGIVVPQGNLDMGLFFERDGSWFGSSYLQTFEPRIFYFYSDFESHEELYDLATNSSDLNFDSGQLTFNYNQLFRDSRFSGGDRIEDANQVSVGLTTRFLDGQSGVERLRLSLGQIFYQDDRRVSLDGTVMTKNRSEIAGQFAAQLTDSWRFSSDVLYDHEDNVATSGNLSLRYFDDQYRILNLSYRYTRNPEGIDPVTAAPVDNDVSQGDLSFLWPMTDSWSVIGRGNYDFTHKRELDSIFGLEYNSCCYRIRIVGRHWLDEDLISRIGRLDEDAIEIKKGIFFEFQFKGLGGLGNRLSNMLNETVVNHEKREQQL